MLLVEDEDVVRNFAARALARQGYEVLEAGDRRRGARGDGAREGQGRHRRQRRRSCRRWTGRRCSRSCARPIPDLKFIFVSGYPDDAFKKSLDENEAYAFLPKPFTLPQLAAKVKEQLGL